MAFNNIIMLLIVHIQCGTCETKCVNSIILCQHVGNKLLIEP